MQNYTESRKYKEAIVVLESSICAFAGLLSSIVRIERRLHGRVVVVSVNIIKNYHRFKKL